VRLVVEVVLPVVTDAEVEGEIRLQADVVFNETADNFFQEDYVALSGLQEVGADDRIAWRGWRSAAGEGVGALAVGEVVEATAADIGNVDAEAELMFSVGVGGEVGAVEVIFGAAGIGLGATGGEESGDCELRVLGNAADGIVVVADEKS
jgi:hypothetical protein